VTFASPARVATLVAALSSPFALAACANTVQDRPVAHNILEGMVVAPYPVYWLGGSFRGMAMTEATKDPGGAYRLQYGDCVLGGQSTCVPDVRVVTSPDNSFVPGPPIVRTSSIRGVPALVTEAGRTLELPTGGVVISVHSPDPRLAAAAAQTLVPINQPGVPLAALPPRLPDTGFAETPLPTQMPSPLRAPSQVAR
jgi:hypothetical protein